MTGRLIKFLMYFSIPSSAPPPVRMSAVVNIGNFRPKLRQSVADHFSIPLTIPSTIG